MQNLDEMIEIQSKAMVNIAETKVWFLTDSKGDAWLTKESIIEILCRDGNYSFKRSFPGIFETKVVLSFTKGGVKCAKINEETHRVFHESVLYRAMFTASSITGFNNERVTELIDSIFMDVLPSLRKYGQYPPPKEGTEITPSKWGAIREIASQMETIARLGEEHDQRINDLEWKTTIMDEEKTRDQEEINYLKEGQLALQNQIDEFLGTPDHRTVRLRMMEFGIKRSEIEKNKMAIGQMCKKHCQDKGINLPEKIVEGSYMVNQYPIEVIDRMLKSLELV